MKKPNKIASIIVLAMLILLTGIAGCAKEQVAQNVTAPAPGIQEKAINPEKISGAAVEKHENLASFKLYRPGCVQILESGSVSDKIDLTFIGQGYDDIEKFKTDVQKYTGGFFAIEPFKSSKGRFNVYYVNQTSDFSCKLGCKGIERLVCCDDASVKKFALQCPADKIIVLINTETFCGTASDYAKVCTINDPRAGLVLVHEIGHALAGLGDEYGYAISSQKAADTPNCASEGCSKWDGLGAGCFAGCGYSNWFRPTDKSCIMNEYINQFCPVCSNAISNILSTYSSGISVAEERAAPPLNRSYLLQLNYDNGKINSQNAFVTPSSISEANAIGQESYSAEIVSFDNKTLYRFAIKIPTSIWPFHGPEDSEAEKAKYSEVIQSQLDYALPAPYFKDARQMNIYDKNGNAVSVNLAPLAETCGNKICEIQENYLECPQDCPLNKKDNLCLPYKDKICDPDCSLFRNSDPDCINVWIFAGLWIAISLIFIIVYFIVKRGRQ